MVAVQKLWLLVPDRLRRFPADLAVVIAVTAVTCLSALVPGLRQAPLRVILGVPFTLLVPGYAVTALLFPEAKRSDGRDEDIDGTVLRRLHEGVDGTERAVLSFGLSVVLVPLVGLALNFTPIAIDPVSVLLTVSGVTVAAAGSAAVRRWNRPPAERFRVDYDGWLRSARTGLATDTRTDRVLNVVLVLSVLVAVGSASYAVAAPKADEGFTEFYLLTQNETGELVADDYPTEFVEGEGKPLFVGVDNHEQTRTTYEVVVELQRTTGSNDTVPETRELERFRTVLEPGERWRHEHVVRPNMVGENLRLQYLIYKGGAPADPEAETAYRRTQLWVNVSAS